MDGTQIDTNDVRLWMFICKVNRPDSSTGPSVKDTMEYVFLWNRSGVQLSLECEEKGMVLEIQTIVFWFVIREGVLPVL